MCAPRNAWFHRANLAMCVSTPQIGRWPFRKLKSMDKLIRSVRDQAGSDPLHAADAGHIIAQLEHFKQEIYANPEVMLDEQIKKLRQANFKLEYKQRQQTHHAVGVARDVGAGVHGLLGESDDNGAMEGIGAGDFVSLLTGLDGDTGMGGTGGGAGAGTAGGATGRRVEGSGDIVFSGDALAVGASPRAARRGARGNSAR